MGGWNPEILFVLSLLFILIALAGYILGSIPTGFLVARARGVDIRAVGSGNIGATNAFRILGRKAGTFVLLVDATKGWLACSCIPQLFLSLGFARDVLSPSTVELMSIVAGFGAVIGHNYTCWLGFKGGKGIATSAGVLAALAPWALLVVVIVFLAAFGLSRYVSLGSLSAALALPLATWLTNGSGVLVGVSVVLSSLAIYKHRANIGRLLSGTENRVGGSRKEEV